MGKLGKEELERLCREFSSYAIGDIIPKCLLILETKPLKSRVGSANLVREWGNKLIDEDFFEKDDKLIWKDIPEEEIAEPELNRFFEWRKLVGAEFDGGRIIALPKSFEEKLAEAQRIIDSGKDLSSDDDLNLYLYKWNYLSKMAEAESDYLSPIQLSDNETRIITPVFKLTEKGRALVGQPKLEGKSFQNYEWYIRKLHDFLYPESSIPEASRPLPHLVPDEIDLCTGYYPSSEEGKNSRRIVFTSGESNRISKREIYAKAI